MVRKRSERAHQFDVKKNRTSKLNRQSILVVSLLLVASFSIILTINPSFDLNFKDIDGNSDADADNDSNNDIVTAAGVSTADVYGPITSGPAGQYRLAYNIVSGNNVELIGWDSAYNQPSGNLNLLNTVSYNSTTYTVSAISGIGTAGAFAYCNGITSVTIQSGISSIDKYAFVSCTSLASVILPSSVTNIGIRVFYGCTSLTSINLGNVTYITTEAFSNCTGLTSVDISKVNYIGSRTFNGCTSLTSVTLSSSATTIVSYAFNGCSNLSSLNLGGATTIGDYAFNGCTSLTSVTIPSSVTSIGTYSFHKCTSLTSFSVDASNSNYSSDGFGVLYDKNKTVLIRYPEGNTRTSFTIPSSVNTLGEIAFSNCINLTSVTIPSSVKSIGNTAFGYCTGLPSITIPSSATSIGHNAFYNCTSLTSVTIPSSVTSIGNNVFYGCTELTAISVDASNPNYSSDGYGVLYTKNKNGLIQYPLGNTRTTFTVPSSVTTIYNYAFYGSTNLTSIDLGNVQTIGAYVFRHCSNLISVEIPSSVKTISDYAFANCTSLTSVFFEGDNLPGTVGSNAFPSNVNGFYSHGTKASSWWAGKVFGFPAAKTGAYYELTLSKASGETVFQGFANVKVPSSTSNYATVTPITQTWTEQYVPAGALLLYSTDGGSTWKQLAGVTLTADTTGQGKTGFIITYNINNGSGATPSQQAGMGNVTLHNGSGILRTNYYLAGWNTQANGNGTHYDLGGTYNLTANATLYAEWKQYTITFDPNNATSGSQAAINGYGNTALPSSSTLARTGYYLSGWNTNAAGTGTHYNLGATYNITGNVTLFAEWSQYTITYNANNATTGSNFTQQGYGSTVLSNGSSLARTNYYLAGWNTSPSGNGNHYDLGATYNLTWGVTFYAEWKQYTVSYNNNTGLGSIGSQSGVGLTLSNGAAFTKPGYTLTGWNTLASGAGTPYTLGQAVTLSGNLTLYAVWNANPVIVTYHGNGGTGSPANASGVTDGAWTLPSASQYTRPGYTLAGWATVSGGPVVYGPGATTTFVHTITNVYAVWTAESITVNFNGNGGTGSPSNASGVTGGTYTLPTAAQYTRPGYTLAGWDTNSAGTTVVYDAGGTTTFKFGEITLYAVWEADPITVTYHGNGGTGPAASSGYTGGSYTLPSSSQYTRPGYTLTGWDTDPSGTTPVYSPGSVQTFTYGMNDLYAVWLPNSHTVTYHGNGGTGSPANVTDVTGGTWTLPDGTAYTRPGYTLVGWSATLNGAKAYDPGQVTVFTYGINNVYAIWQGNPITVNFDPNGGTGSPASAAGIVGGSYTLPDGTQYTNSGYTLLGWDTSPSASTVVYNPGQTVTFKNGETTLYAVWSGNAHTVTYNGNGGTGPSSASGSVGGAWTLPTAQQYTRPGYTLTGWSKTNGGAQDYTPGESTVFDVSVTNVYAIWSADSVTVTYNGNYGTGSPSDDTGDHDSPWTLPGAGDYTRPGYTLAGWSLTLNGAIEYTPGQVSVFNYAVTDVYAVWTADPVTVTYDPKGGSGTPADSSGVTGGSWTLPTATEYTRPGYTLIGWDTSPAATLIVYTPGQTTVFAYDVTTVYAVWSPNSMTVNYHGNGGSGSPSSSIGVTGGQWTLPSATDYTRVGYVLVGWDTNPVGTTAVYLQGTTAAFTYGINDVYAVWAVDTSIVYNVTVNAGANGSATADNAAPNGGDTVTVTITPDSGYLIDTITDNGSDVYGSLVNQNNGSWTYTITSILADHTIEVTFKVDTAASHTVSGTVNPNAGTGGQLNEGFTVTLNGNTVTTISDGVFSFTVPGGFTGPIVVSKNGYTTATFYLNTVTEDKTGIVIDIAIRSYTVTFNGNGADPASGPWPQSFTVDHGYALSSMPADPYQSASQFAGWYTYGGVAFDPTTLITQNTDLYAYWYPIHEITVTIDGTGSGTVQVNNGFGWFDYTAPFTIIGGTTIQIRAIPDTNHSFLGWTGDHVSNEALITLTPTADVSLTATFEEPPAPPTPGDSDDPFYKSWMFWLLLVLLALLIVALYLYLRERRNNELLEGNIFMADLDSEAPPEEEEEKKE